MAAEAERPQEVRMPRPPSRGLPTRAFDLYILDRWLPNPLPDGDLLIIAQVLLGVLGVGHGLRGNLNVGNRVRHNIHLYGIRLRVLGSEERPGFETFLLFV